MATTRSFILSTLKRMRVLAGDEDMDQQDAQDALQALNDMMFEWGAKGMSYEHTELTLNDEFPLAGGLHNGVKAMLAVRLADDFLGGAVSPVIARDANAGERLVMKTYYILEDSSFDPVHLHMNRRWQ